MNKALQFMISFCLSLAVGVPIRAQEPAPEPHIRQQMVVTAQFKPESSKDTLIEVKVLDSQQIEQRGAQTLAELLVSELHMETQQHSVFGTSLAIDGVSHENVKILINGMPLTGRLDGIIDLEQVGLAGFERVEIIKGPASVYYGTDALGGVVNLIPINPKSEGYEIDLKASYRDIGDEQQSVRAGFAIGSSSVALTLARRHFNGENTNGDSRRQEWAEREQESGSLHWRHHFEHLSVAYLANLSDEHLTDLGEFQEGVAWDQDYHTQRLGHQVTLEGQFQDRLHYSLLAGYSDYERKRTSFQSFSEATDLIGQERVDPAFDNAFKLSQLKAMLSISDLLPTLDGQVGVDWSLEEGSGGRILDESQDLEDQALFGGLRWNLPGGLVLQPMVRLMHNSSYDAPTTPSLHLKYATGPLTWRASYSRGFRGPSIKQLYLDFALAAGPFQYHITGNEDLKAERGHHYNLSLDAPLADRDGRSLSLTGRLFYDDIDDLITLSSQRPDPVTPNLILRNYVNINEHRSRGAEMGIAGKMGQTNWDLSLARTETFNALSAAQALREYDGRWDGRLFVAHHYRAQRISLLYKHVGQQPGFLEVSAGRGQPKVLEEVKVADYERIDLFWHYRPKSTGLFLGAGVKNLADVRDRDTIALSNGTAHETNQLAWGRSFHLEMGWSWTP